MQTTCAYYTMRKHSYPTNYIHHVFVITIMDEFGVCVRVREASVQNGVDGVARAPLVARSATCNRTFNVSIWWQTIRP